MYPFRSDNGSFMGNLYQSAGTENNRFWTDKHGFFEHSIILEEVEFPKKKRHLEQQNRLVECPGRALL